jgi:hypothetical protein
LVGGIYSAQPIAVDRPVWRADLLEAVAHPGTLDRAHHHPSFSGWDPSPRVFVPELSADPVGWVGARLSDLDGLLDGAGVDPGLVGATDRDELRAAVPEILDTVGRMLARVRAGELAPATGDRVGWL